MTMRLGVIIPAHNEAHNIANVVSALQAYDVIHRLLVVDDGSTDGTREVAYLAGAEVLALGRGQGGGKGRALRAGIAHLKPDHFDYYLFLDGDGQHDPQDVRHFLDHLDAHPETDFLIGSRKEQQHLIPRKRWITNSLGTWALGRIVGLKWEDSQSGFRMVRKSVVDRLTLYANGFAIEMEIAMKAAHRKIHWAHIPISVIYHPGCPSHFKGARDVATIFFYATRC